MPLAIAPPVQAAAAPPAGYGRLVVDVVDGPVAVQRIRMDAQPIENRPSVRLIEVPEVLCAATPCAVDIPIGNVLLGFAAIGNGALETELVHVSLEPSVYRRALSEYRDEGGALRVIGIIMASIGGASMLTGTALLPIGLSKDNSALTTAGGITLGGGAALLAFGIWAIRADSPTFRPGSSNHFPLSGAAP